MFRFEKLATRQGILSETEHLELHKSVEEVSRMLSGLRTSLKSPKSKDKSQKLQDD
jgi:hypothetical protein